MKAKTFSASYPHHSAKEFNEWIEENDVTILGIYPTNADERYTILVTYNEKSENHKSSS